MVRVVRVDGVIMMIEVVKGDAKGVRWVGRGAQRVQGVKGVTVGVRVGVVKGNTYKISGS